MKHFTSILSILTLFALSILPSTVFAQAAPYQMFVAELKTDKFSYMVEETIEGQFRLDNNGANRQSDIMFSTELMIKKADKMILLEETFQDKNIYLEANSKRYIDFKHKIKDNVSGDVMLRVNVYTGDGTLVGSKDNPLTVTNSRIVNIIDIVDVEIVVNGNMYGVQTGPTVSDEDAVSIDVVYSGLSGSVSVTPKIVLRDRNYQNNILHNITLDPVKINPDGKMSIKLPVDLDPLVYAGTLTFESKDLIFEPIYFRYITKGDIGTILNVNTDKLTIKKGEIVNVTVMYGGVPIAFNIFEELAENNNDRPLFPTGSDTTITTVAGSGDLELGPIGSVEQENPNTNLIQGELVVLIKNEKGEVVAEEKQMVDLSISGEITFPVVALVNAKDMSIDATLSKDAKVLSEYSVELPSQKDLDNVYKKDSEMNMYIWLAFALMLFIVIVIILVRKKVVSKKQALMPIVGIVTVTGSMLVFSDANALTIRYAPVASMTVNAVISPKPSQSDSYAPGEAFNLEIDTTFAACVNAGNRFSLYGPPTQNWTTFVGNYFEFKAGDPLPILNASFFGIINRWPFYIIRPLPGLVYYTPTFYSWTHRFLNPLWGDNFLVDWRSVRVSNYDATINWWTDRGGTLVVSEGGHGTGRTGRMSGGSYNAPTVPGFYDFPFMMLNNSNGNNAGPYFAYQEICVRGAGVCPNEVVVPPVCPNLTGTYTQNTNGTITGPDGESYTKNAAGQCIYNQCAPGVSPANLGTTCGCAQTGVFGTFQCDGSCENPDGVTIPAECLTCDNTQVEEGACTVTQCGELVPGSYSCTPSGWKCTAVEQRTCPQVDVCSEPGIQPVPPLGTQRNEDGSCTPPEQPPGDTNQCSITNTAPSSYCVQLFDKDGNATYEQSGISQTDYDLYYKNNVESIYPIDTETGKPTTDHTIWGTASSDAGGQCIANVCPVGVLQKSGCFIPSVGVTAQCYAQGVDLQTPLQTTLTTSPDRIFDGGQCIVTWTSQGAASCTLKKTGGGTLSTLLGAQAVLNVEDSSVGVVLTCTAPNNQTTTKSATCRVFGNFSER